MENVPKILFLHKYWNREEKYLSKYYVLAATYLTKCLLHKDINNQKFINNTILVINIISNIFFKRRII